MSKSIRRWVALLAAAAAPSFAGVTFTQVMTTESSQPRGGQGGGGAGFNMTSVVEIDNGQAKMDLQGIDNPMMPAGSYMLIRNGGDDVLLVKPSQKTYSRFDFSSMMGGADQMMQQMQQAMGAQGCNMEFDTPKVEKVLEEAGPQMLGYPTKHFRYHTVAGWQMKCTGVMAMASTSSEQDSVEDVWTTSAIDVGGLAKFFGNIGGVKIPDQFKEIAAAKRQALTGFPLKRIVVSTSHTSGRIMGNRSGGESKMTAEVKDVKVASIPGSVFEIPAGYTETQMMQRGPAMPNLNSPPPPPPN